MLKRTILPATVYPQKEDEGHGWKTERPPNFEDDDDDDLEMDDLAPTSGSFFGPTIEPTCDCVIGGSAQPLSIEGPTETPFDGLGWGLPSMEEPVAFESLVPGIE